MSAGRKSESPKAGAIFPDVRFLSLPQEGRTLSLVLPIEVIKVHRKFQHSKLPTIFLRGVGFKKLTRPFHENKPSALLSCRRPAHARPQSEAHSNPYTTCHSTLPFQRSFRARENITPKHASGKMERFTRFKQQYPWTFHHAMSNDLGPLAETQKRVWPFSCYPLRTRYNIP